MGEIPVGVQFEPAVVPLGDARMSGSMMSLSVVVTGEQKNRGE
jgi:hypothetical protein